MSEPAAAESLGELLRAASAARPEAIFARVGEDGADGFRLAALDALADRYASRWREAELPAGARAIVLGAPEPRALAAIVGATRAGLDVAVAPPTADAPDLAAMADRLEALAIAGPSELAGLSLVERLFHAGALCESVRVIATHGARVQGAHWLDAPSETDAPAAATTKTGALVDGSRLPFLETMNFARAFVAAARPSAAIVSLISLGAPGGLVCGALAPMLAGAHMIWQAPFSARRLFDALDASRPAHLIAPMRVARELRAAGLPRAGGGLTWVASDDAALPDLGGDVDPPRVLIFRAPREGPPRLEEPV